MTVNKDNKLTGSYLFYTQNVALQTNSYSSNPLKGETRTIGIQGHNGLIKISQIARAQDES